MPFKLETKIKNKELIKTAKEFVSLCYSKHYSQFEKNNKVAEYWNNEEFRNWAMGLTTNIAEPPQLKRDVISANDSIQIFDAALASHNDKIISTLWLTNAKVKSWYLTMPIQTLSQLGNLFLKIVAGQCASVTLAFWKKRPMLKDWLTGQRVMVSQSVAIQNGWIIQMNDAVKYFEAAVNNKCYAISNAMWQMNKPLQNWVMGLEVNCGTQEFPRLDIISEEGLLHFFKIAVASKNQDIPMMIWRGNRALHNNIKKLSIEEQKSLLISVLESDMKDFTPSYLQAIENIKMLRSVLRKLNNADVMDVDKINLLKDRINDLKIIETASNLVLAQGIFAPRVSAKRSAIVVQAPEQDNGKRQRTEDNSSTVLRFAPEDIRETMETISALPLLTTDDMPSLAEIEAIRASLVTPPHCYSPQLFASTPPPNDLLLLDDDNNLVNDRGDVVIESWRLMS